MAHKMYFKELSDYNTDARKYKFVGLQSNIEPWVPSLGDVIDLETIGKIVSNGHIVIIIPRQKSGRTSNKIVKHTKDFTF